MKSEVKTVKLTRLFNKALICNNIKRFWWVSLLYTIGLFLLSPLLVLTNVSSEYVTTISFNNIFDGTICFLFIVPVFLAVIVFRYMQNPKSMVTIHAMPYNRLDLYVNNIISGLILLIVPILLNTALLSYIELFITNGILFEAGIIMKYLWISLLISTTLFSITVAIGMVTGSSIAQIIFTYIINFLPAGIIVIFNYLLDGIIYGFSGVSETTVIELARISPIVQTLYLVNNQSISDFLITDIIITILVLIIGYIIYRYRNLEDAGEVISGKLIKPIFKYGVTICVMLVGTIYVKAIFEVENPNFLVYILFALLGYATSEMLLRKSFKILNTYKGFVGFVGAFAIVVACIHFDIFGYESFVPKAQDVECFSLDPTKLSIEIYKESGYKSGVLISDQNIEKIINLNKDIVANKEENKKEYGLISINYLLNNGRTISRTYRIDDLKYKDQIQEIKQSKEYKLSKIEIFSRKTEEIETIRISNEIFGTQTKTVADQANIVELAEAIKKDVLSDNYKDIYDYTYEYQRNEKDAQYNINILYKNKNSKGAEYYTTEVLHFNKDCINVSNYIDQKAKEIKVGIEDIESIEVYDQNGEIAKVVQDKAEIEKILSGKVDGELLEIIKGTAFEQPLQVKFKNGEIDWIQSYQLLED